MHIYIWSFNTLSGFLLGHPDIYLNFSLEFKWCYQVRWHREKVVSLRMNLHSVAIWHSKTLASHIRMPDSSPSSACWPASCSCTPWGGSSRWGGALVPSTSVERPCGDPGSWLCLGPVLAAVSTWAVNRWLEELSSSPLWWTAFQMNQSYKALFVVYVLLKRSHYKALS